jgi:hypothetical protein
MVALPRSTRFAAAAVYRLTSERLITRLPSDWPQVKRREFASCGGIVLERR